MERAPLYRYLDDITPLCPQRPAHGAASPTACAGAGGGGRPWACCCCCRCCCEPRLLQTQSVLLLLPLLLLRAHPALEKRNASVREMYLNIDAVAMHEPGTVDCTSCSGRPGQSRAQAVVL